MKQSWELTFSTADGIYRSSVPNIDEKKDTFSNITFVTYQLKDTQTNTDAGILKLSITSVPSDPNNPQSPTLNTYTFLFFLSEFQEVISTEYSFVTTASTGFPSFKQRVLSISGRQYCRKGTVEVDARNPPTRRVKIRLQ